MAAWMEERRGDMGLALEEPWVQPLGDLLQAGKWSVRTIVKDGMVVTKQAEAVWEALLAESTRMIATAGGEPPSALDLTLALQWALSPTALFGSPPLVTRESIGGMERTPGDHIPPPLKPAIEQLPPVLAVIDPEPLPSQLARDDMTAQGASRVTDLLFVSVTLELGRPAVAKEIEGGEYASSLAICSGIQKATKSRGYRGFSEMLAQAKVDGDLGPPDRHMEKLQSRLMTTSSPAFHMTTGSRLTQFWSRSKTVSEDGRVVAYYVLLIVDMYSCRGMPVLYDHELMRQAERAVSMLDAKSMRAPGLKFKDLGGAAGREDYPSSQGSSVSTTTSAKMDELGDRIMAQLTALTEGQTALVAKVKAQEATFDSRIQNLSSKMGRLGETPPSGTRDRDRDRDRVPSGIECIACGKKGHKMANCPDYTAFKKAQEGAKEE